MYREAPLDDPARREALLEGLQRAAAALDANRPGSGALLADDQLVWFRNLGFLSDPGFCAACAADEADAADALVRTRIWRVHTLCWAARSCLALEGDFVDLGCYDGKTVEIMARYARFASQPARTWWLYDLFEDPPPEARKAAHGPGLRAAVEARLAGLGRFRVVQGSLPQAFDAAHPERVAFAQLDLNAAAPELACLERLWERLVPGALLVLDDFGFARYRDSHAAETRFLAARGAVALELPTGQGLVVRR